MIVGKYAYDKPFVNVHFHIMKPCSNLSCHRRAKGLSQAQLAIVADMEVSHISRIERGVINTSVVTLLQIVTVLEVVISELLPPTPVKEG